MGDTVSDFLLKRLSQWGIKRIYGYPGDVPTLPPHISFEQAKEYTSALVKGDPEEGGIIKQSVKSLVGGIFPHKDK